MKRADTKKTQAASAIQAVARGYLVRKNRAPRKSADFLKLLALMNDDHNIFNTVDQLITKEKSQRNLEPDIPIKKRTQLVVASPEASMNDSFDFSNPDLTEQNLVKHNKKVRIDSGGKNHKPPAVAVTTPTGQRPNDLPLSHHAVEEDNKVDADEIPPPLMKGKSKTNARSFKVEEFISPYNEYYNNQGKERNFLQRRLSRAFSSTSLDLPRSASMSAFQSIKSEFSKKLRKMVAETDGFRDRTAEEAHK